MECVVIDQYWTNLLMDYGSLVLFVLLALGIVALPIPDETLLVLAGALMGKGVMLIPFTVLAAWLGSICGITLSYLIGRTGGHYVVYKYGEKVGITHAKLQKVHDWFARYGKWTLFIGYFVPGVRHFTGITAGTSGLEYHYFSLYAYSGAIVWVSTFLTIGFFFGHVCFSFLENIDTTTALIVTGAILLAVIYAIFHKTRRKKK